jgi:hypothetical protein
MPTQSQTKATEADRRPSQQGLVREVAVEHRQRRHEVTVFRVIGEPRRACASRERGYRFVVRGGRRMPA